MLERLLALVALLGALDLDQQRVFLRHPGRDLVLLRGEVALVPAQIDAVEIRLRPVEDAVETEPVSGGWRLEVGGLGFASLQPPASSGKRLRYTTLPV